MNLENRQNDETELKYQRKLVLNNVFIVIYTENEFTEIHLVLVEYSNPGSCDSHPQEPIEVIVEIMSSKSF